MITAEDNERIELNELIREAAKKVLFLVARPLREGGVRARPLRKKELFLYIYIFIYFSPKIVAGPLKKRTFFAASLTYGYGRGPKKKKHKLTSTVHCTRLRSLGRNCKIYR